MSLVGLHFGDVNQDLVRVCQQQLLRHYFRPRNVDDDGDDAGDVGDVTVHVVVAGDAVAGWNDALVEHHYWYVAGRAL